MKVYILWPNDQRRDNWLIKRWVHTGGRQALRPLAQYDDCVCSACGRIQYDDVFRLGFDKAGSVGAKGDMLYTDDNFWCMSQNAVEVLQRAGVKGARFKKVADTEWYVINIETRVQVTADVYRPVGKTCATCGENTEIIGSVAQMGQFLEEPPRDCIFSTAEYRGRMDRDVFVGESVLTLLRDSKITGCVADLIPTSDLYKERLEAWQRGDKVKSLAIVV